MRVGRGSARLSRSTIPAPIRYFRQHRHRMMRTPRATSGPIRLSDEGESPSAAKTSALPLAPASIRESSQLVAADVGRFTSRRTREIRASSRRLLRFLKPPRSCGASPVDRTLPTERLAPPPCLCNSPICPQAARIFLPQENAQTAKKRSANPSFFEFFVLFRGQPVLGRGWPRCVLCAFSRRPQSRFMESTA